MKTIKSLVVSSLTFLIAFGPGAFAQVVPTPSLPGEVSGGGGFSTPTTISSGPATPVMSSVPEKLPIGSRAALASFAKSQIRKLTASVSSPSLVNYERTKTYGEVLYTPRPDGGVDIDGVVLTFFQITLSFETVNLKDRITLNESLNSGDGSQLFTGSVSLQIEFINGSWRIANVPSVELSLAGRVPIPFPNASWAKLLLKNSEGNIVGEEPIEIGGSKGGGSNGSILFPSYRAGALATLEIGTYQSGVSETFAYDVAGDGQSVPSVRVDGVFSVPSIHREIITLRTDGYVNVTFGREFSTAPLIQWKATRTLEQVYFAALSPDGEQAHTMWMYSSTTKSWQAYELPEGRPLILKVFPGLYDIIFEFKRFGQDTFGFSEGKG